MDESKNLLRERRERKEAHDAFVRWQEVRRVQLGHVVNLVLVLSTAALGFGLKLLIAGTLPANCPRGYVFAVRTTVVISMVLLVLAIGFALLADWTRLLDLRYTAKAARSREKRAESTINEKLKEAEKFNSEHQEFKNRASCLGRWTWGLLISELIAFFFGAILLAFGLWGMIPR